MANTFNLQTLTTTVVTSTNITVSSGIPPNNLVSGIVPVGSPSPGPVATWSFFWYKNSVLQTTITGLSASSPLTFNYTGLSPSTTYNFLFQATENANNYNGAIPGSFTTAPIVSIGSLTQTSVGPYSANLTHPAAVNGTPGYTFQWYRSTVNGFTPGPSNILSGQTATTLNDTGLSPATTYYYRVRVADAASYTALTPQLTVLTSPAIAIGALTQVTVGSSQAQILAPAPTGGLAPLFVQWFRSTSGPGFAPGPSNILAGQTTLLLQDSGLTPATTYYYKVVATDSAAVSVTTTALSITTFTTLVLGVPAVTDVGSNTVTLLSPAATGGAGGTFYQWYRSTSAGFVPSNATVLTGQTSLTLADSGLLPSHTYYYICRAQDVGLDVADSSEVSSTTLVPPLSIGVITPTSVGHTTATLAVVSAVGGAGGPYTYAWYQSETENFTPGPDSLISQTGTIINVTGLSPGTLYFFICIATDTRSNTAQSPQLTILTSADNALAAYYANLLILQYLGKPKAYATIQAFTTPATLPCSSTSSADTQLALAVQNAFNLGTAQGAQLDILGKYAGVTRYSNGPHGAITLNDADFTFLIRLAIQKNYLQGTLYESQAMFQKYFPGQFSVNDNKDMSLTFAVSKAIGSTNLFYAIVTQDLLPRPMGVGQSVIYIANIANLFTFSTREAVSPRPGFNSYANLTTTSKWLSYADFFIP